VIIQPRTKPASTRLLQHRPTFVGPARPRIVTNLSVYDAALDRIRWLFDEFDDHIMVSNSGGKDSTVLLELAAIVNNERGRKRGPLKVHWLDQECEFQATVDYQRYIMYERPDIDFRWYQIPFKLENSSNMEDEWLYVWDPELEPDPTADPPRPHGWVRDKEPNSIHVNDTGEWEFYSILKTLGTREFEGAILDGIRADESPARRLASTSSPMYKWTTWSAEDVVPSTGKHLFRFHPIYDWLYHDVWKAIQDHGWRYNEHYEHLFQHGISIRNMRVSNYHHKSALSSLTWLQEVEPDTWEAATKRLSGISTWGHIGKDQIPTSLPYMFASWDEYLDHLIENLVTREDRRATYRHHYAKLLKACSHLPKEELAQVMVTGVLGNDFYGVHIGNFMVNHRTRKDTEWRAT